MRRERKATKIRHACSARFLCLLIFIFLLLVNGCSYHDKQFSYFDMLDENKRTQGNKRAAERFWSSVRPVSTLSDSHYKLGRHYQQKGEYDKAINEFAKALRNDPSYCKAHNGIAMSYDALRKCVPAHKSYTSALQCAPDQAYVYNNYGCSSLLCGDHAKGTELLHQAERLAGDNSRIKNNIRIARMVSNNGNLSDHLATRHDSVSVPEPEQTASTTKIETMMTPNSASDIPIATLPNISPGTLVINDPPMEQTNLSPPAEVIVEKPLSFSPEETKEVPAAIKLLAEKTKIIVSPKPATVAVEVSNGNGVTGMAGRSATFLRKHGFEVQRVINAQHFRFEESSIFYREGYLQAAQKIAAIIPGSQNLKKIDSLGKTSVGIRVLLGRDLVAMRFPDGFSGIAGFAGNKDEHLLRTSIALATKSGRY